MRRAALLSLLLGTSALARDQTYCVGGYSGLPPKVVAACNQPEVVHLHPRWHLHTWVTDGHACFVCYDEVDTSCVWDFLKHHPTWSQANPNRCPADLAEGAAHHVFEHVIQGQAVAPSPPLAPVTLTPLLGQLPSTPLATGDPIEALGVLRDGSGVVHPSAGGVFRFHDQAGRVTEVAGDLQLDGSVKLKATVPPGTAMKLEFVPRPMATAFEQLGAPTSGLTALTIEACPLRARITAPLAGSALAPGSIPLAAMLIDREGHVVSGQGAAVTFQVQLGDAVPLAVTSLANHLEGVWSAPASPQPVAVSIRASGTLGDRWICPEATLTASLSDLGVGFDLSRLPHTCYVGLPCVGEARLQRTVGPARAHATAFLVDPKTQVRFDDTSETAWSGTPRQDDRYPLSRTYTEAGERSWSLTVAGAEGSATSEAVSVHVRPALELHLPAAIDFGTVVAGTQALASCRELDFSPSIGAEDHGWTLEASGLGECQARPMLAFRGPLGAVELRPLSPRVEIDALDPRHQILNLCLQVPPCAGEKSPAAAAVVVTPRTPEFISQTGRVALRWTVQGRSALACSAWWLGPLLALLMLLILVAGVVTPVRFTASASIRVAGSEKALRTAPPTLLRDFPGSGAGFYRDARLGLQGDGSLTGVVRHATVTLKATRAGCVLAGHGPVERQDRRSLKWEPVADLARGHDPGGGFVYRSGGIYFRVDPS